MQIDRLGGAYGIRASRDLRARRFRLGATAASAWEKPGYEYRQAATLEEAEEARDKMLADLAKGRQPRNEATFSQLLAFSYAVRWKWIAENPAKSATPA